MARQFVLEVVERNLNKKANVWREEGFIPAEIYGPGIEGNKHVAMPRKEFERILDSLTETSLLTFKLEGSDDITGFIKHLQRHKVSDKAIHLDLYVPSAGHKMNMHIPVNLTGECIGEVKGGILEVHHHEIPVEILPKNVMESIEIDVTNLNVHEHITVADVEKMLPEGTKVLLEENDLVVSVVGRTSEEETTEEAGE